MYLLKQTFKRLNWRTLAETEKFNLESLGIEIQNRKKFVELKLLELEWQSKITSQFTQFDSFTH